MMQKVLSFDWIFGMQSMVFDTESKAVLHTEMAKKNLFVKRGENATEFLVWVQKR